MFFKAALILFSLLGYSSTIYADSQSSNLICHTSELSECYPKVFEPSKDFKIVRDDQDLPPGLHVRLNIQTGLKEAKLYDGNDDDLSNTIEVFPDAEEVDGTEAVSHDSSIVAVEDTAQAIDAPPQDYSPPAENAQIPIPPELLQHVLKSGDRTIKRPVGGDADADAFKAALTSLSAHEAGRLPDILPTLLTLEDLAHDIYWGLTLAQSTTGVQSLTKLLKSNDPDIASTAALVLGNTVHNNPKALRLTLTHAPTLAHDVQAILFPPTQPQHPRLPARQFTRLLFLFSSLLTAPESPIQMRTSSNNANDGKTTTAIGFLGSPQAHALLAHFHVAEAGSADSSAWDRPRQAIADFVLDRIAGPEAASALAETEWQVWQARGGKNVPKFCAGTRALAGCSKDEAEAWARWVAENVLVAGGDGGAGTDQEAAAEERGWVRIVGGPETAGRAAWVKPAEGEEQEEKGMVDRPEKFGAAVKEMLVQSCEVFGEAMVRWGKQSGGNAGSSSAAVEHVLETLGEIDNRLKEVGSECASYRKVKGQYKAREKTEL